MDYDPGINFYFTVCCFVCQHLPSPQYLCVCVCACTLPHQAQQSKQKPVFTQNCWHSFPSLFHLLLRGKPEHESSGFQEDSVQRPILPLDLDPFITERPERRRKRRRIVQSRSSYTYTHQVWELLVFAQHTTAWCTVSTAYTSLQTLSYILNATIYFLLTWRNSHIFYKTDI